MTTIVGSGPSGLTMAYYLIKNGHKVTVIEKAHSIGGCHRVEREDGYFSEHGPRIYLNNYHNTIDMLKKLGINFYDYFVPYKFSIGTISGQSINTFSLTELAKLGYAYLTGVNRTLSVEDFVRAKAFSPKSIDYMDRLCRLTDGAGIKRYTMYEFLQLLNQNALYTTYQPNKSTDKGLFKIWQHKLELLGVKFVLGTSVDAVTSVDNTVVSLQTTQGVIPTNMCILAVPPRNMYAILHQSKLFNALNMSLDKFNQWSKNTDYITYLSITFHWHQKLVLPDVYGFPGTDWGLAYIVLSDYMDMSDEPSKTLITAALTRLDTLSSVTNKTAQETNKKDKITETLRQLRISFPGLPTPDKVIIHNDSPHHKDDTAFMLTKYGYIPSRTNIKNLYNVGTHNGHSSYAFTSMESAVQNAMVLSNHILNQRNKLHTLYTLNYVAVAVVIAIIMIIYSEWKFKLLSIISKFSPYKYIKNMTMEEMDHGH
jgi:uncharacterized protein with NAD-binding domain and iron-sulfur cluster